MLCFVKELLLSHKNLYDVLLSYVWSWCPHVRIMFYRHLRPSTCGHVYGTWFSLEDKRGLSLGELIRPFCIMLSCWYLLLFGLLYYLWYHIYAFSLLFCKVYLKRENSGSWNSGLEKEQILVHYSAHLQMPWKVTWNFLGLYKKYWTKEVPEGGHQGAVPEPGVA